MKLTAIALSPNTQSDDVRLALSSLLTPWRWVKGEATSLLEKRFKEYLGCRYTLAFSSGRSALYAILKSLDLKAGDEVLIQAFTCVAVPEAILAAGLRPIYADIDETLNIDPVDILRKITPRSRVIIVQHTFGWPGNLEALQKITKENNLILIEDCAHALGARYKNKPVGLFGKASFFSFGRDKIISSIFGGVVATDDTNLANRITQVRSEFPEAGFHWVFQQLFHPVSFHFLILPFYQWFNLGKIILYLFQRMGFLGKAVTAEEKIGVLPVRLQVKMPNALAVIALHQLEKVGEYNRHRLELAKYYTEVLKNTSYKLPVIHPETAPVYLRFNVLNQKAVEILHHARDQGFYLGDWYRPVISPSGTDFSVIGYRPGSCPQAEYYSKTSINLPTGPKVTMAEAQRLVSFLKSYGN